MYSVDRHEIAKIRQFLDSFWTNGLEKLRDLAEADEHLNQEKQ